MLKQCQWQDIFSYTTTLDDVQKAKPDPETYLTVLEKLRLQPEQTVVVEDSLIGIQAGHRAGLKVICRREPRLNMDQSGADWYVSELSEVRNIILEA